MSDSKDDSYDNEPIVRLGRGGVLVREHVVSHENSLVSIRAWLRASENKSPQNDHDSLVEWLLSASLKDKTLRQVADMFVDTAFVGRINAVEVKKTGRPGCGYLIYPEWP